MDPAQAIAAASALAALTVPVLSAVLAALQGLATVRPRVPSSRLGSVVMLCASLGSVARTTPGTAAVAPITARAAPAAPSSPAPASAVARAALGDYVVQPGDSLWAIAGRHLEAQGDTPSNAEVDRLWRSIWAANRAVIGEDPDLIFPGTRLTIPEEKA